MQDELVTNLEMIHKNIKDLNHNIITLSKSEHDFNQNPSLLIIDTIDKQEVTIANSFHSIVKHFKETLLILNSLINEEENQIVNNSLRVPTTGEIQTMLNEFLKGNIKRCSAPYPTNCGCYAQKIKKPHPGDFICANYNNSFILMIVLKFEKQICYVCDPTTNESKLAIIELKIDDWTPLPTIIPETPISRYEHWRQSEVLALWQENGEWTTVFYPAKVVKRPSDKPSDDQVRGYTLDFGENMVINVPEQFIVWYPESWQKDT
ncbi:hypothetical protein TRFO_23796 [Tritrichomonas foetus]|uniref:SGF29 C-terminal domain-containing protein n=1 Tax=Tritrichomonas foetus TaxID=1144522 RepID=A0A1J4K9F5_9EUKA|nr:hypothetical protein TRFO_23796 [Tritrichomonas foetus]|eukprot:OHT07851.1 hypothetical protein TRFO_23796 [Tritrichomonas foetus]